MFQFSDSKVYGISQPNKSEKWWWVEVAVAVVCWGGGGVVKVCGGSDDDVGDIQPSTPPSIQNLVKYNVIITFFHICDS